MAVLTSQFFLSDEKGEMDMPSRINGGRASLQQEVDLDYVYSCPQKGRRAIGTHRLETVSPPHPTIHKLDTVRSNGLRDLDRKYELKLCVMRIQSRVEMTIAGPELSSYPRLMSHNGRTNSDDRWRSRYEDADWFKENPNWVVGREVSRTGTTCMDYCPYITEISVNDWAVSNRPAVEAIVFTYPDRLIRDTQYKDTTWIRRTFGSTIAKCGGL